MVITSVRVSPVKKARVLGFASITLCECFVLRAMRIVEGTRRRYLAMPLRRAKDGQIFEVYHPIRKAARETLERVVFEHYQSIIGGGEPLDFSEVFIGSQCKEFRISDVKVRRYEDVKLKGFASIVLDDCLAVTGIKIISAKKRTFLQMPNVRKRSGKYVDLAFPTQPEIRDLIERVVLEEFDRVVGGEAS